MAQPLSPRKKFITIAGLALGLSLVPVTVTSQNSVAANDACADGKCCIELGSWCGGLGGYYDSLDGCDLNRPGTGW